MKPDRVTHFDSPAAFRDWLADHHADRAELWVGYWKKSTGRPSIIWEESVDEALCFGWIDGIRKKIDEEAFAIRFTPRRSGSNWSLRNIERYTALAAAGQVAPSGRAAFEARKPKHSGTYSFEQGTLPTLSDEYLVRLKADAHAWAYWQSRPAGYRKQVAHWVMSAKRESTRERRMATLIEECAAGRKIKPARV